ncbi:transmembrane protein 53 isoform X2 [Nomia melanderi]|uniref:transmembrane protein 53 isoform X2 n=1 Tax=Nomia melanderi TaxID=2448451 RepID=UPI00130407FB|nr:transmembrane protein 53 isoform X2 [Nomia melanderi]
MFPSFPPSPKDPALTTGSQDHQEKYVSVYKEDKRPVVVLLGWAGCQDRYLAKYSAIYEEKSNGGAFLYQHVSLAMQQANTPLMVKGVIFDSAPGERRLTALFKAISAIIGGHPLTNIPMSFFITIFLSLLWFFEVIAHTFGRGYPVQTNPIALAEESYSWPQLFLYSDTDTLIPASDVEKFARRRAERGVRVQLVLFMNSPHVKHYATYPDVYVDTVCNFIHECLTSLNFESLKSSQECSEENNPRKYDTFPGLTKRVVLG